MVKNKTPWYVGGLHFECQQCGECCSGPAEGYIWVTKPEIQIIADFLKITPSQLRQGHLRRVGLRTTVIEHPGTKDCIFLNTTLSLRGAKRRSNLIRSQVGDCHGLFQRPRNDIHTSNTAYRKCTIYAVRPSQCRAWPFWASNLASPNAWNKAAQKCSGINHGKYYSFEEIERIKSEKKWWADDGQQPVIKKSS